VHSRGGLTYIQILDAEFVENVQQETTEDPNWLSTQYHYSTLCSSITRKLSGSSGRKLHSDSLESALRAWKEMLPFADDFDGQIANNYSALNTRDRRVRLSALFQYHETLITLFMGALELDDSTLDTDDIDQSQRAEICAASARKILTVSCQMSTADLQENWYVLT
jgi:hypothetical protein